jgi:hyperosmotically inducible protein
MSSYKRFSLALCMGLVLLVLGSCKPEGPAERAGKEIDKTTEKLGEVVEKKGPMERAGEKIDKAVDNAGEALEEAGDKAKKATE